MSPSTQDVFHPVTYIIALILHLLSLPTDLDHVTLFFSVLPEHESRDSCFQFLVFPWLPYSHGSGQSHAWQTKSKCRHFPLPESPELDYSQCDRMVGVFSWNPQRRFHTTCTFWKAFNFYLSRVFLRDSSFAPELAPLSKKHSSDRVA